MAQVEKKVKLFIHRDANGVEHYHHLDVSDGCPWLECLGETEVTLSYDDSQLKAPGDIRLARAEHELARLREAEKEAQERVNKLRSEVGAGQ